MKSISWWRTSFGNEEIARLAEAVSQEHISQGPVTAEFEDRFAEALDVPYAVATTSGSVALMVSLMALGIGRGDEVIIPNRTWIATAHAALILGAKVLLIDVVPDTPTIDVTQIRENITPRTKAIIPVHLNGRSADMMQIRAIADEHGLFVVEDAAQAMFSRNELGFLGTQSDAGCFSLSPAKLISTGQGGMVVTHNRELYETLKLVTNHGVVDNFTDRWVRPGLNFKFTDLQASFGLVQLKRTSERISSVRSIYEKYASALTQKDLNFLKLLPVNTEIGELPLYIDVLSPERTQITKFLDSENIQVRPSLPNLHTSDYLQSSTQFPNSMLFNDQGMVLPCGPEQDFENIDRVIDALRRYGRQR